MVVIIIGILASLAVPQYFRTMERARAASPWNILASIRSAELRFKALNPVANYTSNVNQLDLDLPAAIPDWGGRTITNVGAGKGLGTFTRSAGTYTGQTVGIQFGTGTKCGTFLPEFPTPVNCVED